MTALLLASLRQSPVARPALGVARAPRYKACALTQQVHLQKQRLYPPPHRSPTILSCRFSSGSSSFGTGARQNPYAVLGVERSASRQEITSAYHALALRWHPDRNPSDRLAEERFKEVASAYRALRDAEGKVASNFSETTGISREEADQVFKEFFGADTLQEASSMLERMEALRRRLEQQILEHHPGAEDAAIQFVPGKAGAIVMRATVVRQGKSETLEWELAPEDAAEFAEVGTDMLRFAGMAVRDVATKVVTEVGQGIANGLANSPLATPLNIAMESVHWAEQLASPLLPFAGVLPGSRDTTPPGGSDPTKARAAGQKGGAA